MNGIDLTERLKKQMASYPRKRGRYNSSELYALFKGWTTPEQWLSPPEKDVKSMVKMWKGILVHDHVQRLLPKDTNEIKKEYRHGDITLVAKADNLPKDLDEVWELKTSDDELDKSKAWHDFQVKLYCTIFERSKGIIYQPVANDQGLYLKKIGEVERDDKWFDKQIEKLLEFHEKVELLANT